MKRKFHEFFGASAASSSPAEEEAPPTPLKVHPAGYTFEFVNDVEIEEGEIFMPVPEWYIKDNKTSVSNKGRVKSYSGKITKPCPPKNGYSRVSIKGTAYQLTHLILHAFKFKRPSEEHNQVNHKDLDPANNCLENLEWCTSAENIQHSFRTNTNRKSTAPKRSKPVECFINGKWQKYASVSEAGRQLNVAPHKISEACRTNYRPKGFRFRYGEPNEPDILENEKWKALPDSKAEVSSLGRFKDIYGIVKTPSPSTTGYVHVTKSIN